MDFIDRNQLLMNIFAVSAIHQVISSILHSSLLKMDFGFKLYAYMDIVIQQTYYNIALHTFGVFCCCSSSHFVSERNK